MEKQKITNNNQDLLSYILAIILKIILNFIYYLIFAPLFFLLILSLILIILQFSYILISIILIFFKPQGLQQFLMFALDIFNQPYQFKGTLDIDVDYLLKTYLMIITGITLIDLALQKIAKFQIMNFYNSIKIKTIIIFFAILLLIQIIFNIYFKTYAGIFTVIIWCIFSLIFILIFSTIQKYFYTADKSIDKILQKYHES